MGIVLVALLSNYTIRTLINCGVKVMEMNGKKNTNGGPVPPPSYPEIGRAAYGEFGIIFKLMISFPFRAVQLTEMHKL